METSSTSSDTKVWLVQRPRIKQLYLVDGLTRKAIRRIMKEQFEFDASDEQYKYQICTKWQFQKTLSSEEKQYLFKKASQRQQQQGKATIFLLSGCPVNDKSLSQYRKKHSLHEVPPLETPITPRNITYYTPPASPTLMSYASSSAQDSPPNVTIDMQERLCITCLLCEIDISGTVESLLWNFSQHRYDEHGSAGWLQDCQVLISSTIPVENAMPDETGHDVVQGWIDQEPIFLVLTALSHVYNGTSTINGDQFPIPEHRLWIVKHTWGVVNEVVGEISGPIRKTAESAINRILYGNRVTNTKPLTYSSNPISSKSSSSAIPHPQKCRSMISSYDIRERVGLHQDQGLTSKDALQVATWQPENPPQAWRFQQAAIQSLEVEVLRLRQLLTEKDSEIEALEHNISTTNTSQAGMMHDATATWTVEQDDNLLQFRRHKWAWESIAVCFPGQTPDSCRKRHERLMIRQYYRSMGQYCRSVGFQEDQRFFTAKDDETGDTHS